MTLLQVRHATTYNYRRAVAFNPHRLMLRPRDSHDLRVVKTELTCSPLARLSWSHDVFGNSRAEAAFDAPGDTLSITSRIIVEQYAPDWPVFAITTSALHYPFDYSADDAIDLGALLTQAYPDPEGRLKTWAKAFVMGDRTDTLSLLKDLNAGISAWVFYQSRDDERTQAPLETLDRGWGSCRDLAVLFADAARLLGFGVRIASGYLFDPEARMVGSQGVGSTHAWAEVYLPGAGWIAFDPTNRKIGGANLIRVATARDIAQVSPISGSYEGAPDDFASMEVSVEVMPIKVDSSVSPAPPT